MIVTIVFQNIDECINSIAFIHMSMFYFNTFCYVNTTLEKYTHTKLEDRSQTETRQKDRQKSSTWYCSVGILLNFRVLLLYTEYCTGCAALCPQDFLPWQAVSGLHGGGQIVHIGPRWNFVL